jgi:DNA-binding HxlR family transcriptional regulator
MVYNLRVGQRLRQLERDGFMARTYHREMPVFQTLTEWSDEHLSDVRAAQRDYDRDR